MDATYRVGTALAHDCRRPVLIYCNGIGVTQGQAQAQAQIIANAFGDEVVGVYNRTEVTGYYAHHTPEQRALEDAIATRLAETIRGSTLSHPGESLRHRVSLFAHGHGAQIARLALETLNAEDRALVSVYTFGGVTMIPKSMAHDVQIYINEGDVIGRSGNCAYDPEGVLEAYLKIWERMKREGLSLRGAVMAQFIEDKHNALDPMRPSLTENRAYHPRRIEEYGRTFFSDQAGDDVSIRKDLAEHMRPITDYDIHILDAPRRDRGNATSLDLSDMAREIAEEMARYATESGIQCHGFDTFTGVIRQIAGSASQ